MKKRERQMESWMMDKRKELENINDEETRLTYFRKVVLPEMNAIERKEQRVWDEHRADFDLDILERGYDENDATAIPRKLIEACGWDNWDDFVFAKTPADIHHLVSDKGLCHLLKQCSDRQKKLLFYIDVHGVDGAMLAETHKVNPRNVTAVHKRTLEHIRTQSLPLILLKFKLECSSEWGAVMRERFVYTTYEERNFCAKAGTEYLDYWEHPYFEGVNFDLAPISEHFQSEVESKK